MSARGLLVNREVWLKLRTYVASYGFLLGIKKWEAVLQEEIPHTLVTDTAAGFLMKQRLIYAMLEEAYMITKREDVANKIGTYTLSVFFNTYGEHKIDNHE